MVIDKQYPLIIVYLSPKTLSCPVHVGGFCGYWIGQKRKEGGAAMSSSSLSLPPMHLYQHDTGGHVDSVLVNIERYDWIQVWAIYCDQWRDRPGSDWSGRPHGFFWALRTALPGRAHRLHSLHICRLHLSRRQRGNHREYSACAGTWTGPGYRYCSVWRDQVRTYTFALLRLLDIYFNNLKYNIVLWITVLLWTCV